MTVDKYLSQVNTQKSTRSTLRRLGSTLSVLVILSVFWGLKLTGITMAGEAFCGMEEHVHSESCVMQELICTLEETPAHVHSDACLQRHLICTEEELAGHIHGEECQRKTLICTEAVHSHEDACYEQVPVCGKEETKAHTHGDDCYTLTAVCGEEESEDHKHSEQCMEARLTCEIPESEGHTHDESCMESRLICEVQPHVHGDDCYEVELICTLEECEGHTHTDACYEVGTEYVCGLEETEGHTHDEACYREAGECPIEEHIHTPSCYSDTSADIETSDDWEDSMMDLVPSVIPAENVVLVAESQLNMAESLRNFEVDEAGIRRGITRYGQWYGNPYGDWSAMFACFCLEYAGIEEIPTNAGPETMRLGWEEEGLYAAAAEGEPLMGFLLFLDKNDDGKADSVALITDYNEDEQIIFAIEGDLSMQVTKIRDVALPEDEEIEEISEEAEEETTPEENEEEPYEVPEGYTVNFFKTDRVARTLYEVDDPAIMGYGEVPFIADIADYAHGHVITLDGTCGGMMSLTGATNESITLNANNSTDNGERYTLPTTFKGPGRYSYTLRGWYDVTNNKYYAPGATVRVTGNMLFYADWEPATYDIGQPNEYVADTRSTNEFITIKMFDYNALFNVLSTKPTVAANGGSAEWSMLGLNGNNSYNGQTSLNFIFRDWDDQGEISYPTGIYNQNASNQDKNNNHVIDAQEHNTWFEGVTHHHDLYSQARINQLFNTSTTSPTIGTKYLGTADHLFQFGTDPSNLKTYGYYYYDSELNAASYNQSQQRFYVYNYLERSTDSDSSQGTGKFSDFLPFNSPYANLNNNTPATYTYAGVSGEYQGVTHYQYEGQNKNKSPVGANFMFGMVMDVDFYLPNDPGQKDSSGNYGNRDIHGNEMHFKFSGDDDVWVFVDGVDANGNRTMVQLLDLGGIHGIESGDINFATGVVTIDGNPNSDGSKELTKKLKEQIKAGEHTLTIYYLERGSSQSNCALYFNLAPRFSFSIQKEDLLTRDALEGAEFTVYTDETCKTPAQLWTSKAAHDSGAGAQSTFEVVNGKANMWGLVAGQTYYIKETRPPNDPDYNKDGLQINGIIKVSLNNLGNASYNVEMLPGDNGNVSGGFTVHGYRIDEETQEAYIVATNAPWWVSQTTSVHARKVWNDNASHSGDSVTVYLTMTVRDENDKIVEVRRLQEATLSAANNWKHQWNNLPKYLENGTEIEYGIEEAYIEGYVGVVTSNDKTETTTATSWEKVTTFVDDGVYLLTAVRNGQTCYLATSDSKQDDIGFVWMTEAAAKDSTAAQWTADVNGNTVRFTNGYGRIMTCYYYTSNGSKVVTDFFAQLGGENDHDKQYFKFDFTGNTVKLRYVNDNSSFYLSPRELDQMKFDETTNSNNAMVITPLHKTTTSTTVTVPEGIPAFKVTNTPLPDDQKTTLTVTKAWNYGSLPTSNLHESARVTIKLLANGKDTGRTVTLTAPNWTATFSGLPVAENGVYINYTVQEVQIRGVDPDDWIPSYGPVTASGDKPTYSTTVTNAYFDGVSGPELPSTGTAARLMYILCGGGIMLTSLVYGIIIRYKRERGKTVAP